MEEKIISVQVLYNPNVSILQKSISKILTQVDNVVLVDNSNKSFDISILNLGLNEGKIDYIFNGKNVGIAEAQNIGVRKAKKLSATYILFMDQDSIPDESLVQSLLNGFLLLRNRGFSPGIVGPSVINRETDKRYKGMVKKGTKVLDGILEVGEVISSGSIIPMNILDEIGLMDSSLFIDGVDHEWCWRAREFGGYRSFIILSAILNHKLGEGDRHFGGIRIAITTPFRSYYQYRNFVVLCKRSYVPFYWKISNFVKYIIRLFYYPCFVAPRLSYLNRSIKGLWDGFFMKNIKCPSKYYRLQKTK